MASNDIPNRQSGWSLAQAREVYNITRWGGGYFDIAAQGRLCALSRGNPAHPGIDLHALAGRRGDL